MRATTGTITRGVLADQRRSLAAWALAIASVSAMYTAFYPAIGAGAAVGMSMSNALGPLAGLSWMTAISPFDWYLGTDPLATGMHWTGAALLLALSVLAAAGGLVGFRRRDLMV